MSASHTLVAWPVPSWHTRSSRVRKRHSARSRYVASTRKDTPAPLQVNATVAAAGGCTGCCVRCALVLQFAGASVRTGPVVATVSSQLSSVNTNAGAPLSRPCIESKPYREPGDELLTLRYHRQRGHARQQGHSSEHDAAHVVSGEQRDCWSWAPLSVLRHWQSAVEVGSDIEAGRRTARARRTKPQRRGYDTVSSAPSAGGPWRAGAARNRSYSCRGRPALDARRRPARRSEYQSFINIITHCASSQT